MGIVDCLNDDKGVVGFLYDTIHATVKNEVDSTVSVITRPRKPNSKDMPNKDVYIEVFELPIDKYSMNPCSFSQGITVSVDVLLPYNEDELSRRIIRLVQAVFYTQLEYAMIVRKSNTNTSDTPLGSLNSVIIDLDIILQRGLING